MYMNILHNDYTLIVYQQMAVTLAHRPVAFTSFQSFEIVNHRVFLFIYFLI